MLENLELPAFNQRNESGFSAYILHKWLVNFCLVSRKFSRLNWSLLHLRFDLRTNLLSEITHKLSKTMGGMMDVNHKIKL
ncbi:hypothetical protein C7421_10425 [Pantoea ananatis]|nr:hypothetical protein C7421_10425 [Pantoea ananatis]